MVFFSHARADWYGIVRSRDVDRRRVKEGSLGTGRDAQVSVEQKVVICQHNWLDTGDKEWQTCQSASAEGQFEMKAQSMSRRPSISNAAL